MIVGKRALPALAVTARELELLAEPDDMVIAFGVELPETPALVIELAPPVDDPYIRQELVETAYHVLWELVHVFIEHNERNVHDTGAASFLYPFLGERETDHEAVVEDVRRSILMKAEEIGALREQTLTEGRETLLAAAAAVRGGRTRARARQRRLGHRRDGPRRRPRARSAGRRSTSRPTPRSSPRSPTTSASRRSSRAR